MARLSNISVVVRSPSPHTTPFKSFDDAFFGRTIDHILSEETSREGSRDEDQLMDNSSSPSLFGTDALHDALALSPSHARSIETRSSQVPTPSPTRVTAATSITKDKKLKSGASPQVKSATVKLDGDIKENSENDSRNSKKESQRKRNKKSKENSKKKSKKYLNNESEDVSSKLSDENPEEGSTDGMNPVKPMKGPEQVLDQPLIEDPEESPEDKIFASVSAGSQMAVLKFIASHAFMTSEVQPIVRSARRQFTNSVRKVAFSAKMDNRSVDALLDFVRKTYLDERDIVAADDAGSSFGDEIDDEEEEHPKRSYKKRSSVSRGHILFAQELVKVSGKNDDTTIQASRQHKRRHSDSAARHGHGKVTISDVSGIEYDAETAGHKKRKRRHSESAVQDAHDEAVIKKAPRSETATITPAIGVATGLVETPIAKEVPEEKKQKKRKRGRSESATEHAQDEATTQRVPHSKTAVDTPATAMKCIVKTSSTDEVLEKKKPKRNRNKKRKRRHSKGGIKLDGSGEGNSRKIPFHDNARGASIHSVSKTPPSGPAKPKELKKEINKKKNLRRQQRRLETGGLLSEHQPDISAEHPAQEMNTPIRPSSSRQSSKEIRSPHPPLPADPNLWDVDF
ncbi:hypothetical protein PENANT_c007G08212 [Penicillium antarcticum]|uniref:Uncharacterized protein n=1 Tax=Penicillium antarcticum TaxID=416450 RepID=A0A1V6QC44_9EURO|nr:hypothetical protein PENANT_c007G08212 [Penicillium antarcticum]